MATAREWLEGARLRTLPASISPVIAGTGVAWFCPVPGSSLMVADVGWETSRVVLALLCLVVALAIQVGSNLANDYSDGIRGTDVTRVGPQRLVGSGAASPRAVKRASYASFAVACLMGLVVVQWATGALSWMVGRPATGGATWLGLGLIVLGAACIVAAWWYTGGKHPYGYAGLGEVFVFVFYGLVATLATAYVLTPEVCTSCVPGADCPGCVRGLIWGPAVVTAVAIGVLAVAILVANNLRDRATDAAVGKRTLAVRLGDRGTRALYVALVVVAAMSVVVIAGWTTWWALIGLAGVALVVPDVVQVMRGAEGSVLISVLKHTGWAELATALLLAVGWWAGAVGLGVTHA